jgi:hypothetical protein
VKCAALWVRIGLLEAPEQLKLSGGGEKVVFLQDIPVGTEVEVEKKGLQTIVYVNWKRQVISIQAAHGPVSFTFSGLSQESAAAGAVSIIDSS